MKTDKQNSPQKYNAYLRYSGLAFQLAAMVCIGLFGGKWIDNRLHLEKPVFSLLLVTLFFGVFMYKLYKDLSQKDEIE